MTDLADDVAFDSEPEPVPPPPRCEGDTAWKVLACLVRSGLAKEQVVKDFMNRADVLDLVPQIVSWAAVCCERGETRRRENAVERAARAAGVYTAPGVSPPPPLSDKHAARRVNVAPGLAASWQILANDTVDVPLPSGKKIRVPWLEMTVEQHRWRAEELRRFAQSVTVTADKHERAAEDCERAGVNTLAELIARSSTPKRRAS